MGRNLALLGCGAIARTFYFPALANLRSEFDRIWLVDPSDRARSTAASIGDVRRARQLAEVDDEVNLVIVATPNYLHFPLAQEALSRGADVLIEKPFVIWPQDGVTLIETAARSDRVIAINQTRRFFPLSRTLRERLGQEEFGRLQAIVHREGFKLAWPFESGVGFSREAQRTGVVMDFGVHAVDFYQYLLQPRWTLTSAIHDGFNGPEGLADIELRANEAPVSIRLSRYHRQENIVRLQFQRAELWFDIFDAKGYDVRSSSGKVTHFPSDKVRADSGSPAEQLLLNFIAASERRASAVCDAASSLPVIEILDQIYRLSSRYPAVLGTV